MKFDVLMNVYDEVHVTVEADSEDEALELAKSRLNSEYNSDKIMDILHSVFFFEFLDINEISS